MATEEKKTRGKGKKKVLPNMFDQTKSDAITESNLDQTPKTLEEEITISTKEPIEMNLASNETVVDKKIERNQDRILEFDFSRPVYYQLHKDNLYSIFSSSIIVPARYSKNRAFPDVQTIEDNVITVSNGALAGLDRSQILCEIFISEKEQNTAIINGAVGFLTIPIPVSRIKKIFIADESVRKDILTTALTADGGIIPSNLTHLSYPDGIQQVEFAKPTNQHDSPDHTQLIRKYDKMLGAFAFLKNYSWLLFNRTNVLSSIPLHLYYMMNSISEFPEVVSQRNERATVFYRQLFGLQNEIERPFLKWIFHRLNADRNFTDADTKEFGAEFMSHQKDNEFSLTAKNFFNDLTDSLKRKKAIQEIWNNSEPDKIYLYLFAFLRSFGNTSTEDKSTSRKDIPEIVAPGIGEYIFACLGYFYGYKLLRNFEDEIKIADRNLRTYTAELQPLPLKFDLSSEFDYSIIEAVYQTVFYSNTHVSSIDFIDYVPLRKEWQLKTTGLPKEYLIKTDHVLGKMTFSVTKPEDNSLDQLKKLPDIIPVVSELGIFCLRNDVTKTSINFFELVSSPDKWKYLVSFKREHVIEAIKAKRIDSREVIHRMEISKKHKEI